MEITTRDIAVGDYSLRVSQSGDPSAETVLFLHGSGPGATALSNWEAVISDLGSRYHCVAPDILGFGDSTHPEEPPFGLGPFTELRVETLFGLLDELGVQRVNLVGNSMGGLISLRMAVTAPERIGKLILMGSGGAPTGPGPELGRLREFYDDPSVEALSRLLSAFVYDPGMFGDRLEEIAAARIPRATRPDVRRSHLATFHDAATAPVTITDEQLAALDHETLVIHGREDRFIPLAAGYHFFERIPNARMYGLGKCGHWTQIEQHARFVNVVDGFLKDAL